MNTPPKERTRLLRLFRFGYAVVAFLLAGVAFAGDRQVVYGVRVSDGAILWRKLVEYRCMVGSLNRTTLIVRQVPDANVNGDMIPAPLEGNVFDIDVSDGALSARRVSPAERAAHEDAAQNQRNFEKWTGEVVGVGVETLHRVMTFGVKNRVEFRTKEGATHWLVDLGGDISEDSGFLGDGIHVFVALTKVSGSERCGPQIQCYEPKSRRCVWKSDVSDGVASNCRVAFQLNSDDVYAMCGRTISCIDARTGTKRWAATLTPNGVDGDPVFPGLAWSSNKVEYLDPLFVICGRNVIVAWSEGIVSIDHKTGKQQWIRLVKDNKPLTIKSAGLKDDIMLLTVDVSEPMDLFVRLKAASP